MRIQSFTKNDFNSILLKCNVDAHTILRKSFKEYRCAKRTLFIAKKLKVVTSILLYFVAFSSAKAESVVNSKFLHSVHPHFKLQFEMKMNSV